MSEPSVLLCNPPTPAEEIADREAAYGMGAWLRQGSLPRAPHTLAWSAAQLKRAGWLVNALDALAEGLDLSTAIEAIMAQSPSILVLLSSPTTAQHDLDFLRALRPRATALRVLIIGLASRYLPHSLVQEADMVLLGEPEGAIDAACRHLLSAHHLIGECAPQKLNVTGYDGRDHLLSLEDLPRPAWEYFPLHRYDVLPIVASRGCTYGCRYCAVPVTQGRSFRTRDAEEVADEIYELHTSFGVKCFHFWDPVFALDRQHAEGICDALLRLDLPRRITWSCETRPEQLDLRMLQRMKSAGCAEIHLGLESVSPETLIASGRLTDPRAVQSYLTRVREIVLGCRAFEISCHLYVLAGLPGNRGAAGVTRTFLRAYSTQAVRVSPLTPYPGTSIFPTNQVERESTLLSSTTIGQESSQTEPVRVWKFLNRSKRATSA